MVTSLYSVGSPPSLLSRVMEAWAMPWRERLSLPQKIMSSVRLALSTLWLRSPSTQRMASAMFDLPLPLGPTMAVIPSSKANSVLVAKVL